MQRPFQDTVQEAPTIVHGKVGMSYSDWGKTADGGKRLYTFYELLISEVLKGNASGNSLIMREIGGEKDGVGLQVPGAAQFNRGEDVVVMLSGKNEDGSYDVWGLTMGRYVVQKDESGQESVVGAGITAKGDEQGIVHPDDIDSNVKVSASQWTLDRLRQLIQTQASQNGKVISKTSASPAVPIIPNADVKTLNESSTGALPLQSDLSKGNGSLGLGKLAKAALFLLLTSVFFFWMKKNRRI